MYKRLLIVFSLGIAMATANGTPVTTPSKDKIQSEIDSYKSTWSTLKPAQKQAALLKVKELIQQRNENRKQFFNSLNPEQKAALVELHQEQIEQHRAAIKAKLATLSPEQKEALKTKYAQRKASQAATDTASITNSKIKH